MQFILVLFSINATNQRRTSDLPCSIQIYTFETVGVIPGPKIRQQSPHCSHGSSSFVSSSMATRSTTNSYLLVLLLVLRLLAFFQIMGNGNRDNHSNIRTGTTRERIDPVT